MESIYKKVDGKVLIEIKLSSVVQLFNTFDPAPFHEKELDSNAEHYIIDIVNDFPAKTQFRMLIHIPQELIETERAKQIVPAIHNHFAYKMLVAERKFRARFRFGRNSMIIGLSFLSIALVVRQLLISTITNNLLAALLTDALLIIGWAAMWEPVTVLLYELWPIIQKKKTYERISKMEIEVLPLP